MGKTWRLSYLLLYIGLLLAVLTGCRSIARGITEGILESRQSDDDDGVCIVRGPAFEGLATTLDQQAAAGPDHATKVLMVHGIGRHLPGYSGRLIDNLSQALGLDVVQAKYKEFILLPPLPRPDLDLGNQELGSLRISRYRNKSGTRELLFYELTWSNITASKKAALAYDDSQEYAYRRAPLNRIMKSFFNTYVPDPIIYTGDTRVKILVSVTQSLCWIYLADWDDLPDGGSQRCPPVSETQAKQVAKSEVAIITHSLGSRIALDALQAVAQSDFQRRNDATAVVQILQAKEIPIYMLANQLPLMQLGFVAPAVNGEIPRYCHPNGDHYAQRLFKQLLIVAFSDPNDILSYAIPPHFAEQYISSLLCPEVVNVTINVAPIQTLPVLGAFANPRAAHNQYEDDARVIGLITHGVGTAQTAPAVQNHCSWLETRN